MPPKNFDVSKVSTEQMERFANRSEDEAPTPPPDHTAASSARLPPPPTRARETEPTVRVTVDLPASVHRRYRMLCVRDGIALSQRLRWLAQLDLEQNEGGKSE